MFEQTVLTHIPHRVAFAHVDCDWYDPVKLCLAALSRTLSRGGRVIVDDYTSFEGARRATDEFLAANPDFRLISPRANAILLRA